MNDIAKIIATQGLSSVLALPERPTPQQELAFEKRRRERINALSSSSNALTSPRQKRGHHVPSTTADATISRILKEGEGFINDHLTPSDIKIYNYFLNTTHLSHESAVSQQRIADEVGVNPCTISRCLNKLEDLRLIKRKTYGNLIKPGKEYIYRQHCTYEIPNFMFRKDIAFKLHKLFSAISYKARSLYKFIAISMLFAQTSLTYPKISSLSEYARVNNRYLYKQGISTSKCTSLEDKTSKSPPFETTLEPELQDLHQDTQPLGGDMEGSPISEFLQKRVTPRLNLTRRGQFHLAMMTDSTLEYALEQLESMSQGNIDMDWKIFLNSCEYYINRHKQKVDFDKTKDLIQKYGCNTSSSFYKKPAPITYNRTGKVKRDIPKTEPTIQQRQRTIDSEPDEECQEPVRPTKPPDFSNPFFAQELQALAQKFRLK